MRVRVVVTLGVVDGVDLSRFQAGCFYDTDPLIAALLIAEGWAFPVEPVPGTKPTPISPKSPTLSPYKPVYKK